MTKKEWKKKYVLFNNEKPWVNILALYKYGTGKKDHPLYRKNLVYSLSVFHKNNKCVYIMAADKDEYMKKYVFCLSGQ